MVLSDVLLNKRVHYFNKCGFAAGRLK